MHLMQREVLRLAIKQLLRVVVCASDIASIAASKRAVFMD